MKLIHLADLHLGKRVNEFSLLEDQEYILKEILNIVDAEKADGVIIAGDVYDKSLPSTEAVTMFDDFLVSLASRKLPVFIIAGNHDSPERLAFGNRLIDLSGIHISSVFDGKVKNYQLKDEEGPINIYLLPFIKPANVRAIYPDEKIESYDDALKVVVKNINLDKTQRNILVTHQFITGAQRSDSEDLFVGGLDNISAEVFKDFDYVALGHIHRPQNIQKDLIRYCGSPLKYSFSEAKYDKSVTLIELGKKGDLNLSTVPLVPKHDMKEIKGTYDELTKKSFYDNTSYQNDYLHITLTDEEEVSEAIGKLRSVYPYLMKLDYDNQRTQTNQEIKAVDVEHKSPYELFSEFYEKRNNQPMSEQQSKYLNKVIEDIWKEED